jgi:glycogen(starch) synthase
VSADNGSLDNPSRPASGNGRLVAPWLFEVSWEVCAQAGGIYTVLRSKAPAAVRRWGDGYWLLGPHHEAGAKNEFESAPATGVIGEVVDRLRERGIVLHCGRWLVTGRPQVLLFDLHSAAAAFPDRAFHYWKDHGIESPEADWEFHGVVTLGYAVAEFLTTLRDRIGERPMLAHFHEWQAAGALPILARRQARFPTVFTTHATLVGRGLSAANVDLYDHLPDIDAEAVASEHGFAHRFAVEKAAAGRADIFTTVSGITGQESEHFLGRKPDFLLPNGLNIERFAAPYQFQNLHRQSKDLIHEFVMGHFFPSYRFDLDRTLYVFTAGRYEFRNKGIDLFIESLHALNQRLKADGTDVTVVAFIIAPAPYRSLNVTTLNRQAMFGELRATCESISGEVGRRLFRTVAEGRVPTTEDLLDEYAQVRLKRMMFACHQGPMPTIVTHDLVDDANDPVLCHLRHRGLVNNEDDRVKVVFHPEFITSTSPVLGLEYDEFVRGCNIGVFPSYYEPWGYTPMECVVRGIPAVTSDLSGFGAYVMNHLPDHDRSGIYVVRRRGVPFDAGVEQITNVLHRLTRMSRRSRIKLRNAVESHAEHFDWISLTRNYRAARRAAFAKYYPKLEILPPEPEPPEITRPRVTEPTPTLPKRRA